MAPTRNNAQLCEFGKCPNKASVIVSVDYGESRWTGIHDITHLRMCRDCATVIVREAEKHGYKTTLTDVKV